MTCTCASTLKKDPPPLKTSEASPTFGVPSNAEKDYFFFPLLLQVICTKRSNQLCSPTGGLKPSCGVGTHSHQCWAEVIEQDAHSHFSSLSLAKGRHRGYANKHIAFYYSRWCVLNVHLPNSYQPQTIALLSNLRSALPNGQIHSKVFSLFCTPTQ